jgi:organic radical activating enzyme
MHGDNPIRGQEDAFGQTLRVQEVFPTIQGEGPFAGIPSVFVRLAGCNLACWFCDTDFESNIDNIVSVDHVVELVVAYIKGTGTRLVVLTGGEPYRQNIDSLIVLLTEHGYHVQVETAGTIFREPPVRISVFHDEPGMSIVVSPKTGRIDKRFLPYVSALKYIVRADELAEYDGLPIMSTQAHSRGEQRVLQRPWVAETIPVVYLQPMDEPDPSATAKNVRAAVDSCMKHGHRLSIQMHKAVGIP